jgi:hypothetical protein
MLCNVALVRTDISGEVSSTTIRVTRIGELGTLAVAFLRSTCRLLVAANFVPSSPILVTLMMEALRSSETSTLTRATRLNFPEDGILHLFPSSDEERKTYLHIQCLKLALSKGLNRVGVSLASSQDRSRYRFRNVVFSGIYNSGRWPQHRNPVIPNVLHHPQNPLDSPYA